MKYFKGFLKLLFFLISLSFLWGCQSNEIQVTDYILESKETEDGFVIETENAIVTIEKDYLTETERLDIVEKIQKGIDDVKAYLGDLYIKIDLSTTKIPYFIRSGSGVSNARGGIELYYVKENQSPYIHETVHALAHYNNKRDVKTWLREGLATYLNDYFKGNPAFPNDGIDVDKLGKQFLMDESYKDVLTFDSKFVTPTISGREKRQAYYVFSGSLVKYIIEEYGKDKLLKVYYSGDFERELGKSFESIKNEWIEYLLQYN